MVHCRSLCRSLKGFVLLAKLGMNLLNWFVILRNHCNSLITWPRDYILALDNSHFSALRVRPAFSILLNASDLSCSSWFSPNTKTSSIILTVPLVPLSISPILLWKCSGANAIPNSNLWNWHLPKGVMKVVNAADSDANGICQNPELTSTRRHLLPLFVRVLPLLLATGDTPS